MTSKSVLILESHARASLAIIKSFLDHGIDVTAASDHYHCAGFFVRGLKKKIVYPSIEANEDKFIEWLLNYLIKNSTEMLLPLGDAGVNLIAKYQDEIRKHTLLFMPDYRCYLNLHDKILANKTAECIGIPIPSCWYPDEVGLDKVLNSISFPALIKPAIGVGARGIVRVNGISELQYKWDKLKKFPGRMFVQEMIPLTGKQYVADTLIDKQMRTIVSVCSEKVRFYPITGGASTLNMSVSRNDIVQLAEKLMKSIGYYGIGNADFIEDPRDKTVKFLEINPRFGEMHGICNIVGIDLPYLLYQLSKNEQVDFVHEYPTGKFLRFGPTDLMWFLKSKNRFKATPGFWRSLSNEVAGTLVTHNDYGPLIGYILENALMITDFRKLAYRFFR